MSERNYGCRISYFTISGYEALAIENEKLRIGILYGKGCDIYEFLYKRTDTDFMYREPNGLAALNNRMPSVYPAEGNFFDSTVGGWYELFPNAGGACNYKGASFGVHGEAMFLPWEYRIIKNDVEEVEIKFILTTQRTPLVLEKSINLRRNSAVLDIKEKVINTGKGDFQFLWGHHITLGKGFLNKNCRIMLPDCIIYKIPEFDSQNTRLLKNAEGSLNNMPGKDGDGVDLAVIPAEGAGISEMLFVKDLKENWYAVSDMKKGTGFGLCWDISVFKGLWFWQEFNGTVDYPWYGRAYAMALEPCSSNIPGLKNAAEKDGAISLGPGNELCTWLTAVVYESYKEVKKIDNFGNVYFN